MDAYLTLAFLLVNGIDISDTSFLKNQENHHGRKLFMSNILMFFVLNPQYFSEVIFFFFLYFLGPLWWHMEVPRLGV